MNNHEPLLAFLRGTAPIGSAALWQEITLGGQRKPPSDLPQKLDHMTNALLAMALAGKVRERDGLWEVVNQPAKVERVLFW